MSIRRPRGPKPTLKHLAFLEAMRGSATQSAEYRSLHAALLTLRLFDAWSSLGAIVADVEAPALRATRAAVDAALEDAELQEILSRIVDGIVMLSEPDVSALLTRLTALGELYAARGADPLATEVHALVQRYSGSTAPRMPAPAGASA